MATKRAYKSGSAAIPDNEAHWPAYSVERVPIAELIPAARNPRTHTPEQIKQIAASIVEFGWTMAVLRDEDGGLIAGHGRILAAADELGLTHAPVITARGWTDAQKRAYVIADNKLTLNSDWDNNLLKAELGDLRDEGFDLALTGFASVEIDSLFADGANDPGAEWTGMPEFANEDKTAFRSIQVHFPDQNAVDEFATLIGQKITEKTRFVWFPQIEIETYADKRYEADE